MEEKLSTGSRKFCLEEDVEVLIKNDGSQSFPKIGRGEARFSIVSHQEIVYINVIALFLGLTLNEEGEPKSVHISQQLLEFSIQ